MSAVPIQEPDNIISELPQPKGPGARLKDARVSKGIELERVAAQLHLSQEMLLALEADDYENMPARVFVVGYLRNYARFIGLPSEAILQALNAYLPADEDVTADLPKVGSDSGDSFNPSMQKKSGGSGVFKAFFLLLAIFGVVAWYNGYFDTSSENGQNQDSLQPGQADQLGLAIPTNEPAIEPMVVSTQPQTAVLDNQGANQVVNQSAVSETVNTLEERTEVIQPVKTVQPTLPTPVAPAAPAAKPASVKLSPETNTPQTNTPETNTQDTNNLQAIKGQEVEVQVTELSDMVAKTQTPISRIESRLPPAAPVTDVKQTSALPAITLKLNEKSWIEVRDSTGKYRLNNLYKAGVSRTFGGQPPYKVLIGNVHGAILTINGEPFDLKTVSKANVARFTIDPGEL